MGVTSLCDEHIYSKGAYLMSRTSNRTLAFVDRSVRHATLLNKLVERAIERLLPTTPALAGCSGVCETRCNQTTCRVEFRRNITPGSGCCPGWNTSGEFCG